MGPLDVEPVFRTFIADMKGFTQVEHTPFYPKPEMKPNDTVSIKGKEASSDSERERLLSDEGKGNTKKQYNPAFSKPVEQFKSWKNSLTEKFKKAIPAKNNPYEALPDHGPEKPTVSEPIPVEQVRAANQGTHKDFNATQSQVDALHSIRDRRRVYSSSERRKAESLLDKADGLKKGRETLSAREGEMSAKDFKHFEKDVREQTKMSEKWSKDLAKLYEKIERREKADLKVARKKLAKQSEQKKAETAQKLEVHQTLLQDSQKQLDRIRAFQQSSKASRLTAKESEQMKSLLERGNVLQRDREGIIHNLLVGNLSKAESAQLTLQSQCRKWEQDLERFHQTSSDPNKSLLIDPKKSLSNEKMETEASTKPVAPQKARATTPTAERLTGLKGTLKEEAKGTEPKVQKLERIVAQEKLRTKDSVDKEVEKLLAQEGLHRNDPVANELGRLLSQRTLDTKDSVAARLELKLVRTHRGTQKDINKCIDIALDKENPKPKYLRRYEKLVNEHLSAQREWNRVADSIIQAADQKEAAKAQAIKAALQRRAEQAGE